MLWLLLSIELHAASPTEHETAAVTSSGDMLRSLLLDAGFSDIVGEPPPAPTLPQPDPQAPTAPPEPPPDNVAHVVVPAGAPVLPEGEGSDRVHVTAPEGTPRAEDDHEAPSDHVHAAAPEGATHGGLVEATDSDRVHVVAPEGAPNGPAHSEQPPEQGGQNAPGFAFSIAITGRNVGEVRAVVAETSFILHDDGAGEDLQARDGVWTAMIEHYPPNQPIDVLVGGDVLFSGEIQLVNKMLAVPRMEVSVSQ